MQVVRWHVCVDYKIWDLAFLSGFTFEAERIFVGMSWGYRCCKCCMELEMHRSRVCSSQKVQMGGLPPHSWQQGWRHNHCCIECNIMPPVDDRFFPFGQQFNQKPLQLGDDACQTTIVATSYLLNDGNKVSAYFKVACHPNTWPLS